MIAHKRSIDPSGELSPLSGFGIVTLASLYPIIAVEILALLASWIYPGDLILEVIGAGNNNNGTQPEQPEQPAAEVQWYSVSPVRELVFALRAITPLVLLLLFILKVLIPPLPPLSIPLSRRMTTLHILGCVERKASSGDLVCGKSRWGIPGGVTATPGGVEG